MKRMLSIALTGAVICFVLSGCTGQSATGGDIETNAPDTETAQTHFPGTEDAKPSDDSTLENEALWTVGFGLEEIIADDYDAETDSFGLEYYVAGYRNENIASGMLDPQFARAAYISDGETAIVVAAVDCVGMLKPFIDEIKAELSDIVKQYKLSAVHIAATHTHAGIDTLGMWGPVGVDGKNSAFMEKVKLQTAKAIKQACSSAREGRLYYGKADTGNLQRDSRLPEIYDANVHRFRFEPADSSAGLQIISYGAHPEALRSENSRVSADYPCYMGRKIKEETGDDFIFFAGALGGLIMTERQKDASGTEYPVEKNVVITGERLAGYVLSISNEEKLEPYINSKISYFSVNLDNDIFILLSSLGVIGVKPVPGGGRHELALETQASLLNLGGKSIALVPGELFPELVSGGTAGSAEANPGAEKFSTLQEITGDENLLVWGLCDDELGYIVTPSDFLLDSEEPYMSEARDSSGRKHYEETNSVGIEMYYRLAQAFEELAEQNN